MPEPAGPGRILGDRYRLLEPLARGGMASVWIGEDTLLARRVAIKLLRDDLAADPAVRSRFRNEAIAAASVAHPGIVATFDTGEDDGLAYIVMELVPGPNLRRLLDERGRLPPAEAARIARAVALALDVAHRNGIVHRDVKPANVLLTSAGAVKVTDFGIAKAESVGDLTGTGMVLGTARYLAPEQVRGETADPRTDVYALGLLLYEMLAGTLPFTGDTETAAALARLTTAPAPLPADVPPALGAVVRQCLAVDRTQRYPSAAALAAALGALDGGQGAPPPAAAPAPVRPAEPRPVQPRPTPARPTAARTRPRRRRRSAWPFALLTLLLVIAGAVAGYLVARDLLEERDSGGGSSSSSSQPFPGPMVPELVGPGAPSGPGTPTVIELRIS